MYLQMRDIVLIAHDIRSTHNVGSLIRTAECLGVKTIYLTGYSPYPATTNDPRLPHLARKIDTQIAKTSLGAEDHITIITSQSVAESVKELKNGGYKIIGLEQTDKSVDLKYYHPTAKIALIVGNERYGIDKGTLNLCDQTIEIPMLGEKESLNVVQATAIAMYHIIH